MLVTKPNKKRLLELFAGKKCVGKIANKMWMEVVSLDYNPKFKCDLTMDILDFSPKDYIKMYQEEKEEPVPDAIWASPDCTTFSFASAGFYRNRFGDAVHPGALIWDTVLAKTLGIIEYYLYRNPNLIYWIENPRGYMERQSILIDFLARTNWTANLVTYCSYWYKYRKPTHIFTNEKSWVPKKRCGYKTPNWAGNDCKHEACTRKVRGGIATVGQRGDARRSLIPSDLIKELLSGLK